MPTTATEATDALKCIRDALQALQTVQKNLADAWDILSLETQSTTTKPAQPPTVPTSTPQPLTQPATKGQFNQTANHPTPEQHTNHISEAFNPLLREKLVYTLEGAEWIIKGKEFLQPNDFREVIDTVQTLGGKYVSAGKNSHFQVPHGGA